MGTNQIINESLPYLQTHSVMERMEGREGEVMAESSRSELTSILGESQLISRCLRFLTPELSILATVFDT
jgi:hypothetical protein